MTLSAPGRKTGFALAAVAATAFAMPASAFELYNKDGDELHFDGIAMFGLFYSEESYATFGTRSEGSRSWREGFVNYGFTGTKKIGDASSLYGRISLLSSGTWGDGDAGGVTSGNERRTAVEDAYLGWRSGSLTPALGEDGIDISFGSQQLIIGDGFLINGDALNLGDGLDREFGTNFDRGGAYWLAARKAFDKTAVLRLGGGEGLRSDIFWLESDNNIQARMELAGVNLEYVSEIGTFAAMYIEGLGVDKRYAAESGNTHRDGQKTWSLRYQGNAGVENLFLSAEYVDQDQGDSTRRDGTAWYLEAGWTFADVGWTPEVAYRYTDYSSDFDPLFFGFNRGYGTWFQGEVAGNYAGPFGRDAKIHHVRLGASPRENLQIGVNYFDFKDATVFGGPDASGRELDIYAMWTVHDNLIISPLIGFYDPKKSAAQGGTQIGSSGTSTYAQVLFIVPF